MSKFLITGRAGSGKSAVNAELRRRGLNSMDADDVRGLANWEDLKTGQKTQVDPGSFVDYSKVGWNWNPKTLSELLAEPRELFLCGSASNELDYHRLFDKVFVLTLDPETQRKRLQERSSKYGKGQDMQDEIVKEQEEFVGQAVHLGALAVNSTKPIVEVVDEILEMTNV
jgi:broad-specificity NMP kinase